MGKPGTVDNRGIGWYNISKVGRLNGTKKVILGNHDDMPIEAYRQYFQVMRGMFRYKGIWLSHPPIHPTELRGKKNIHGHTHSIEMMNGNNVDERYLNVCVEANLKYHGSPAVEYSELMKRFKDES